MNVPVNRTTDASPAPVDRPAAADVPGEFIGALAEAAGTGTGGVFGEPIVRGDVTIVPVARVAYGFGGGLGRSRKAGEHGTGGGGGGGGAAVPIGYIEIRDGGSEFKPIRPPLRDALLPIALTLVAALAPAAGRRVAGRLRRSP
ncbi:GerW family sporulation protein [Spirillospora albida]|uniref:GerW family sporulation protein n=1 Tax=Spirillospora albida TaxID=58123 RepID=UPI00068D5092|nr:spore germination protein GerW family protein [Spirillospora albida]